MIQAAIEYVVAELNNYLNLRSPFSVPGTELWLAASSIWMGTSTTTPRRR